MDTKRKKRISEFIGITLKAPKVPTIDEMIEAFGRRTIAARIEMERAAAGQIVDAMNRNHANLGTFRLDDVANGRATVSVRLKGEIQEFKGPLTISFGDDQ